MVNPAHEAAVFERLFGPGPHLLRGAEVLTEQALFARFFDEEAANQALMAPPLEAVEETDLDPRRVGRMESGAKASQALPHLDP